MAKIIVDLEAFYGYSCGFQGHGSEETDEIEVSDKELDALKKLGKEKITAENIVAAIEEGDTILESLHEQLSEKFYYMVEEYWLYEADNEFLYECLADHIKQDISDGLYTPSSSESDDFESYSWDDSEDDENCEDEDDYEDDEEYDDDQDYDLDAYFAWVQKHDHEFVAERVGLDLDACRDDVVSYTIKFK